MTKFGAVNNSTELQRFVPLSIQDFRPGGTGPTDATIGTTPTIQVLQFDAVAETVSGIVFLGDSLDITKNLELHLEWCLVEVETNGDTCDWTLDYVIPVELATGQGIAKTSTQRTVTTTVTTANGLAIGDVYSSDFEIAYNDGSNPLAANAHLFCFEIHLTNVTGVAAVHLIGGHLEYSTLY